MKRAFLVLGPESSGTRLMTRLLMAAGCEGDGDHHQRWDEEAPQGDLIVMRRHEPVPRRRPPWATEPNLICSLQAEGYKVHVVIISRDWHATAASQVAAPHATDRAHAYHKMRATWRAIFAQLPEEVPFTIVSYESLVARPAAVVARLCESLGLPAPASFETVTDGNAKYYR